MDSELAWWSAGGVVAGMLASTVALGLAGNSVEAGQIDARAREQGTGYRGSLGSSGAACCVAPTGACEAAREPCSPQHVVVWCDPGERPRMIEIGVWRCDALAY